MSEDELPYQRHSETSHEAAQAALPSAGTQRRAVLDLLTEYQDGLIDEEIQQKLRMNPSTERPRRIELVAAGMVLDSQRRRNTVSGRKAVIWQLKAERICEV